MRQQEIIPSLNSQHGVSASSPDSGGPAPVALMDFGIEAMIASAGPEDLQWFS